MDNKGLLGLRGRNRESSSKISNIRYASVTRSSTQTISTNTAGAAPIPIAYTTLESTVSEGWTLNGNGALVVPFGVLYVYCEFYAYWTARSGNYREYCVLVNGYPINKIIVASPNYADCYTITYEGIVSPGDTITLGLRQNTGSDLTIANSFGRVIGLTGEISSYKTAYAERTTDQTIPANVSPYPIYPIKYTSITTSGPNPWTLDGNGYLVVPPQVKYVLAYTYFQWSANSGGQYSFVLNGTDVVNSAYVPISSTVYVLSPDGDNFNMKYVSRVTPGDTISGGVRAGGAIGTINKSYIKVVGIK